jgi:hypothetical protein
VTKSIDILCPPVPPVLGDDDHIPTANCFCRFIFFPKVIPTSITEAIIDHGLARYQKRGFLTCTHGRAGNGTNSRHGT